jgi:hypothetical protein
MKSVGFSISALIVAAAAHAGSGDRAFPLIDDQFDDGAFGTASNAGTLGALGLGAIGGAVYSGDTSSGVGLSLLFDGLNDHIAVSGAFVYPGAFTVESWIKPEDTVGQRVLWDDYGNPGVLMTVSFGTLQWNISTVAHPRGGIGVFGGEIEVGVWQHVAGIYDGTAIRAFVDGVEVGCEPTSGPVIENSFDPKLSSDNLVTTALNYKGHLDRFRIWPTSRSVAELAEGQFAGTPKKADLNADDVVDASDLAVLLGAWGQCVDVCCRTDLDRDGVVSASDLAVLLGAWSV